MEKSASSGLKTADGVIKASKGVLKGVCISAGAAAGTLILYDHASAASGTVVAKIQTPINTSKEVTGIQINCSNGIYADVTGAGVEFIVYYE